MKKAKLILALAATLLFQVNLKAQDAKTKQSISIETFEAKLAASGTQVLDARSPEEYKLNHLKGAINLSATDEAELQQQIDKLDKQKTVLIYSIGNGRSGALAKKLKEQNFKEVYELPGGISKWIGLGKLVESSVGTGLTLTEYNKLIKSDKLVLVDIGSKYCGGCKKLAPTVDAVSKEQASTVKVVKIELYDNRQLVNELKIESVPTLLLYDGDKLVWQKSGVTPKAEIEAAIKKSVALNAEK